MHYEDADELIQPDNRTPAQKWLDAEIERRHGNEQGHEAAIYEIALELRQELEDAQGEMRALRATEAGLRDQLAAVEADRAQRVPEDDHEPMLYVASRASLPARPQMWQSLRSAGWPIISTWIDEAGEGETEDMGMLWFRIHQEIRRSVGVLLYAESEDFPLKGALIECGIALGMGKPVALVLPGVKLDGRAMKPVGSWIAHPLVTVYQTLEQAKAALLASTPAQPMTNAEAAVKSDRERIKAGIMALTMTAESCRGDAGVDTARKALALRIVTLIDGHGDLVLNEAGKRMAESLAEGHQ